MLSTPQGEHLTPFAGITHPALKPAQRRLTGFAVLVNDVPQNRAAYASLVKYASHLSLGLNIPSRSFIYSTLSRLFARRLAIVLVVV